MNRAALAAGIAVGVLVPVVVFTFGAKAWAYGLGLGEGVGLASFFWIRLTVRQIFPPGNPSRARQRWWWHSLARLAAIAAILVWAIRGCGWPAASVLIGFTATQLAGAWLEVRA